MILRTYILPLFRQCLLSLLSCPQDERTVTFDKRSEKINDIFSEHPSTSSHICGDFTIYPKLLLVHSNKTIEEVRYCQDFSITYKLIQIVAKPTHGPDTTGHHTNFRNTSCSEKCSVQVLSPLLTSANSLVSVKVCTKPKASPDVPFHKRVLSVHQS